MVMTNASSLTPSITKRFIISVFFQNTHLFNIYCHSRDDDLGVQTLNPGDEYNFSFHKNFLEH